MSSDPAEEDRRPASRRVADRLQAKIEAGDYPIGSALPTYRELASEHGVAINTALAAVRLLRDAGLVTIRPNAGAHVRDRTEDIDASEEIRAISSELADLRATVQRAGSDLAKLEARLGNLAGRFPAE